MEKVHYMRPLKGRSVTERHLLLWQEQVERGRKVFAGASRAWDVVLSGGGPNVRCAGSWQGAAGLDSILHECTLGKGQLTVWLIRGWEDMVLTGCAELIDTGAIQWRYAQLDGQRCLVRGTWRGKAITITSLPCWTGERWDGLPTALTDSAAVKMLTAFDGAIEEGGALAEGGERQAIATWCAIAIASHLFRAGKVHPSVAGAALAVWKRWLGPRAHVKTEKAPRGKRYAKKTELEIVIPSPVRPEPARAAERHVCYGLPVRQLRIGHVPGPIYAADLSAAYLLGLLTTVLPTQYRCTLKRPSPDQLAMEMGKGTGLALVRLRGEGTGYPYRRGSRVSLGTGRFWTWLCGAELAVALVNKHISEVWTAHLWRSVTLDRARAQTILDISSTLESDRLDAIRALWRALYSSLVGRFAGWRKEWEDVPRQSGFGRWASWMGRSKQDGLVVPWRSIAGRVQRLVERTDSSAAVPLLYGCVTAQVRYLLDRVATFATWPEIVAVNADSLWVTAQGWQGILKGLSAAGCAPDYMKTKAVFDNLWMDGKSKLITERNGRRILRAPGVQEGLPIEADGTVKVERAGPWDDSESPSAQEGCKRGRANFPALKLLEKYSFPARTIPPWDALDEGLLPEELEHPLAMGRRLEDET